MSNEFPAVEECCLTGYQWGDDGGFIGSYPFPGNKDKDAVHLPPRTTLEAPPENLPEGQQAAWNGSAWFVRNAPVLQPAPIEGGE